MHTTSTARTWVDEPVDDIDEEIRSERCERHQQELALDDRIVASDACGIERQAEPRIVEDDFGDDRATEDGAEHQREVRQDRKHGIARAIAEHDAQMAEALCPAIVTA